MEWGMSVTCRGSDPSPWWRCRSGKLRGWRLRGPWQKFHPVKEWGRASREELARWAKTCRGQSGNCQELNSASRRKSCFQPWFSQSRALKTSNVPKKGPGTKSYLLSSSSFHKGSHGLAHTLNQGHRLRVKNANDTRNLKGCLHRVSFFSHFAAGQWERCQELARVSTFGLSHYRAQDRLSLPYEATTQDVIWKEAAVAAKWTFFPGHRPPRLEAPEAAWQLKETAPEVWDSSSYFSVSRLNS